MNKLFTRPIVAFIVPRVVPVDKLSQLIPQGTRTKFTSFPQALSIKFLPNFGYLFANQEIKFDSLFNFLN